MPRPWFTPAQAKEGSQSKCKIGFRHELQRHKRSLKLKQSLRVGQQRPYLYHATMASGLGKPAYCEKRNQFRRTGKPIPCVLSGATFCLCLFTPINWKHVFKNNYSTIKAQLFVIDEGESLCSVNKAEFRWQREGSYINCFLHLFFISSNMPFHFFLTPLFLLLSALSVFSVLLSHSSSLERALRLLEFCHNALFVLTYYNLTSLIFIL